MIDATNRRWGWSEPTSTGRHLSLAACQPRDSLTVTTTPVNTHDTVGVTKQLERYDVNGVMRREDDYVGRRAMEIDAQWKSGRG